MKLFVASTPYNLLNYINLKCNLYPNEKVDIVITNFDKKNEKYYKNLKSFNIFENVYFVEQRKFNENDSIPNKIVRNFKKFVAELKNRYFCDTYFNKYCSEMNSNRYYDEIYVDVFGFMPRFIFNHYYKINKNISVYKVDCGLESYYDAFATGKITKKQIFIRNKIRKNFKGIFLYSKELANVGDYEVFLIPQLDLKNKEFIDLLNKVFDYSENDVKFVKKDFLFLDQELSDEKVLDKIQQQVVDVINKEIKDNYCVKLHPRTCFDSPRYEGVEKLKTNATFEMLCLNNTWFKNLRIITPYSSAAALPKLLFDEEPEIVCLTKIFDQKYIEGELTTIFFESVKNIYRDKNKVYIPETMEEFRKIIKELRNNKWN